jgi:hypothetical protein
MATDLSGSTATTTTQSSPESLTDKERNLMHMAINHWHQTGAPEKASVLRECLAQDRKAPANLVYFGDLQPETAIDPFTVEIPPRDGPGSSTDIWRKFATKTTDMEPEIIGKMTRKDILYMLETKGVIPKVKK